TYGIPLDVDPWGIIVNTDIIDDYNADNPDATYPVQPTSWTEMKNTIAAVSSWNSSIVGMSANELSARWFTFIASGGMNPLAANDTVQFNHEVFNAYLDFVRDIRPYDKGGAGQTTFLTNNLAMMYGSSYICKYIDKYFSGNWEYVSQPPYDVDGVVADASEYAGLLGGFGWAIPKPLKEANRNSAWEERVDMAWKFARFSTTDSRMVAKWVELCGSLPGNKTYWTESYVTGTQYLAKMASIAENCVPRPVITYWPYLDQAGVTPILQAYCGINGSNKNLSNAEIIELLNVTCNQIIEAQLA
ncbi:MAG: hypothetical protein ACI4S9_06150, partial [Christensenellales bacterium]